MLPLRDRAFSEGAQEFLDRKVEYDEINSTIFSTLTLYGDPRRVDDIILRSTQANVVAWKHNARKLQLLTDYVILELLPQIDNDVRRRGLIWRGLACELAYQKTQAEWLAGCALGDIVEGGHLLAIKPRKRLDRHNKMYKRDLARVYSPRFITHFVKRIGAPKQQKGELAMARRRWQFIAQLMLLYGVNEDETIQADIMAQWVRFQSIARKQALKNAPEKQRRKVLKRAAALVVAMLGASTMTALARGEPVMLPGEKFDLQLVVSDLMHAGHGGLSIRVFDKERQHSLAKLCVYVKDTIAIDQVVSFAMHMQAGLEDEILEIANVTSYENDGGTHPLFEERTRSEREARTTLVHWLCTNDIVGPGSGFPITSPVSSSVYTASTLTGIINPIIQQVTSSSSYTTTTAFFNAQNQEWLQTFEAIRQYSRKYWEETQELWIQAVRVQLMGAQVAKFWSQRQAA